MKNSWIETKGNQLTRMQLKNIKQNTKKKKKKKDKRYTKVYITNEGFFF